MQANELRAAPIHSVHPILAPDEYWAFMNAVVAPVVSTLRKLDPSVVARVKADVAEALERSGAGPKELSAGAYCSVARK